MVVLVASHANVSLLSPSRSPTVLDEPVVSVLLISTVSDESHSMVESFGRALGLVVHSYNERRDEHTVARTKNIDRWTPFPIVHVNPVVCLYQSGEPEMIMIDTH